MKSFLAGCLGGFLIIGLFIFVVFYFNLFNVQDNVWIINRDAINANTSLETTKILKNLNGQSIILTPQEYTNNIVEYYNTALTVLISMLVLFSILSYLHLKFVAKEQAIEVIKDLMKDSKEFENYLRELIVGKVEDNISKLPIMEDLVSNISILQDKVGTIENEITDLARNVNKEEIVGGNDGDQG